MGLDPTGLALQRNVIFTTNAVNKCSKIYKMQIFQQQIKHLDDIDSFFKQMYTDTDMAVTLALINLF